MRRPIWIAACAAYCSFLAGCAPGEVKAAPADAAAKPDIPTLADMMHSVWVWTPERTDPLVAVPVGTRFFRKAISLPAGKSIDAAVMLVAVDNSCMVYVNDVRCGAAEGWHDFATIDLKPALKPGVNVIAIEAVNAGDQPNPAGLLGKAVITYTDGSQPLLVPIDATWKCSATVAPAWRTAGFDDTAWPAAKLIGKMGTPPWMLVGFLKERSHMNFPRFDFPGHDKQAQLLSRYLWHHFSQRGGGGYFGSMFNHEYVTTSDMWMADAVHPNAAEPIQQAYHDGLLSVPIADDGYVCTRQHLSHAHDNGWPFPIWTQADRGPDLVNGKTAGWHFQDASRIKVWVKDYLTGWKRKEYCGETAASLWRLQNAESLGIKDDRWHIRSTGPSPTMLSPEGFEIDAFQAPYLQLRWNRIDRSENQAQPYVEWLRAADTDFGEDRRVYFRREKTVLSAATGFDHSIITMHTHPKWTGQIKRMRISLSPGEAGGQFEVDSFFTVYDTRHTINNPIFILASWSYFTWTGDVDFLRQNVDRMRRALRHHQTVLNGLKINHIRNTWPGHDGVPGWTRNPDGSVTVHGGHGIGSNYWDLLPFGWDDMYDTSQYYAATLAMADLEQAIAAHPEWKVPTGPLKLDPAQLRTHATAVKDEANRLFWNEKTGRFVANIDKDGTPHDYGFTFLNLDAIWYGTASDEHAKAIMDWLTGRRIVAGDTSTGADIYHWRFGPRATTLRNTDWYGQGWTAPESIPWGSQVQDGGAVLGFTFYDLWARLRVLGADNAWGRLCEILDWEDEVQQAGGYRKYYEGGKRGTTLQGGGTAGGIGIDHEFLESSLLPSIVVYGFLGIRPNATELVIKPGLPRACPEMAVNGVLYCGARLDIRAGAGQITVRLHTKPAAPIRIVLDGQWKCRESGVEGSRFVLSEPGVYRFTR